ncbi:SLBB domain-containing protein [Kordiimonas sp. SCSIO 12610]|uniref:SLBB domain-containing protein n=1 Tax=Kordiimonas sp. SCSIO 12610 TaxID=2829597 RepID=UPI00210B100B|nr:SLBB domain-containing protein [Kordiimonas sp. SCSIO 12610]UTW55857.1 SLBB domain-containing protein [Kordiimonas sp. SCSIO 12610]
MSKFVNLLFIVLAVVMLDERVLIAQTGSENDNQAQIAPQAYLIGPNDVIGISVFRQPDLSVQLRVASDQSILMPIVGKVFVGGFSEQEAAKIVEKALQEGGVVKNPAVAVQVSQFASQQVSVLGFVARPGSYTLDRATRLSSILAQAGGATSSASNELLFTDYDPKSGAVERYVINVDELLSGNISSQDRYVGNGDVIFVPETKYFYIYGEVRNPGRYRFQQGLTLEQGLAIAGGTTELGSRNGIKRREVEKNKPKLRGADLSEVIKVGDVFYIPQRLF